MKFFDTIFIKREFAFEIKVPPSIEIVHMENKVRFRGTKEDISKFAQEFHRLEKLKDGQICKLDKYTLKVSEYITLESNRVNWIELPAKAWLIMGCKFNEVPYEYEDNPLDFNDCGFINKIPFDIGVEVTDLPLRFYQLNEDGTYEKKIIER